jgi:prepilin-type N-terminal cleavage/methylation domain-containing protein
MKTGSQHGRGFSLVEILVVVAVIGILASVTVPLVTGVPDAAKKEKLEQDVVIVNNAIDAYLVAGGDAAQLTSGDVLAALKSRVYGGMPAEMMGPQGPFLDPAVTTNATDFAWSANFTSDPRPRFFVAQNTAGVVFGKGPATAVGGVAERPDGARPSWLWSYAEATPPPEREAFTPLAVDYGTSSTNVPLVGITLGPPVVTPASMTANLWSFPLQVTMTNTNPAGSSRIYYKVGAGNYTLHDGSPFNVDPGSTVFAVSVSLDPSRYYNSAEVTNSYGVIPLQLAVRIASPGSVTYAQAGGLLQGVSQLTPEQATIRLEDSVNLVNGQQDNLLVNQTGTDKYIPPAYLRDANFVIRYTTDGTDPSTSGTAQTGPAFNGFYTPVAVSLGLAAWGTNRTLGIRAVALSANTNFFTSSPIVSNSVSVAPTALSLNVFPANPIGLPVQVRINETGTVPVGLRKFFTTDGSTPLTAASEGAVRAAAILYSAPVPSTSLPTTSYTLTAQATGPAGYEQWFSSQPVVRNYNRVTVLNPDFVGANISGGDVNGSFRGSIFVSAPANLGIFNAGGQIVNGNLYVPGLPAVETPGSSKNVVERGQFFNQSTIIPTNLIGGRELSADGVLADPQLDLRQIVDLSGSGSPTNYTIKLTKSSFIEGKIYRNVDVPPPPPVPAVPSGLTAVTNTVTGVPATNLVSGIYSNRITMDSPSSVIRLGVAGSAAVSQYIFHGNTFSKGRVEILGPVEIYFTSGWVNSGVVFGSTNTMSQLRVNVLGGDVDLKSDGALYGSLWATNYVSVGNYGILFGSIFAQTLNVAPNGTVNVE